VNRPSNLVEFLEKKSQKFIKIMNPLPLQQEMLNGNALNYSSRS
jgi:hypothetical protein